MTRCLIVFSLIFSSFNILSVVEAWVLSQQQRGSSSCHHVSFRTLSSRVSDAPPEALGDIVIASLNNEYNGEDDPRVWVPQTECLDFRPLCLCVSHGYYVNLLRFRGGGILGCHRHSSPVHAYTLKGGWGYKEHGWHAQAGTYVFEPPGETHTLQVDDDCDEMIALFHVTGALLYIDSTTGDVTGFDDVFTKLGKAKAWYKECGLGEDYVEQFIR